MTLRSEAGGECRVKLPDQSDASGVHQDSMQCLLWAISVLSPSTPLQGGAAGDRDDLAFLNDLHGYGLDHPRVMEAAPVRADEDAGHKKGGARRSSTRGRSQMPSILRSEDADGEAVLNQLNWEALSLEGMREALESKVSDLER